VDARGASRQDRAMSKPPAFSMQTPPTEDRPRLVCEDCGFIAYVNPKVVVGSIATYEDKFLMCRRAIYPRRGFWTLPAGYLEEGETVEAGAMREALEEACARIEIDGVFAIYSLAHLSQVQLMFRARLLSPEVAAGAESLEVALFTWDEIPWDELAFPSVGWALRHYRQWQDGASLPFSNPPA
jgi:ADP-ribose pyrophosphatase YjhB (NUDIX family)